MKCDRIGDSPDQTNGARTASFLYLFLTLNILVGKKVCGRLGVRVNVKGRGRCGEIIRFQEQSIKNTNPPK